MHTTADTLAQTLARNVRSLRSMKGLTQAELAQKAGVSRGTIANVEGAIYDNVKTDVLTGLARALGVQPGELIAGGGRHARG